MFSRNLQQTNAPPNFIRRYSATFIRRKCHQSNIPTTLLLSFVDLLRCMTKGHLKKYLSKTSMPRFSITCMNCFIHMPLGLQIAPGSFKRTMDVILPAVKLQLAVVYLEDIVVFSRLWTERIAHVRKVFALLDNAGVTLKLKNFRFSTNTVDYLGHIITPRRLDIALHRTVAVCGIKEPASLTLRRSFLGLCNIFGRFVPNFKNLAILSNTKL